MIDLPGQEAVLSARLTELMDSLPFRTILVEKELVRNHPLDALAFYQGLDRMLIELLGLKFRPPRFDFGPRYL